MGLVDEKYDEFGVNCIIETSNRAIFHIPVVNYTNCELNIPANCPIAQLEPIINDEQLFPFDLDEILDNVWEACNVVKKKRGNKPNFSRPSWTDDDSESDEKIVRKCVEKYASKLPHKYQEKLIKLILKYKQAFSLRGELGRKANLNTNYDFIQGQNFYINSHFDWVLSNGN